MLVRDFPWVTPSDRANYIGGPLFTPLLRSVLKPAYPLVGIRAPMRGSGKTLLGLIARGLHGGVFRSEFPRGEDEIHKSLTAILCDTTGPVVQFDNVRGTLRSGVLEGLLTSAKWDGRKLGRNDEQLKLLNDRLIIVTGNHLSYGGDLPRRVLQVSIDANTDRPWMGRSFKLKLPQWAEDNRARIIHALLTIARGWMVAGRPVASSSRQDSYDGYVAGVRGLLDFAGFEGTFDDSATQGEIVAEDDDELGTFLGALDEALDGTFTAADITDLLELSRLASALPTELLDKWERCNGSTTGFVKALGKWLKANEGHFVEGRKIVSLGKNRDKVTQWKIASDLAGCGQRVVRG